MEALRVIKNILFWGITAILIVAIAGVLISRATGVEMRVVTTGSMTPELPVGTLVVIVPTAAEDIAIGDDITFVIPSGKTVTHRVIEIDREKNEFTTWGIANERSAVDAPSRYENIVGVVKFHVPQVGIVFSWLATMQGKIIAATVIIALYIVLYILGLWTKSKKEVADKSSEKPTSHYLQS